MKFLIDFEMDEEYSSEEEMKEACLEALYDLNSAGATIKILGEEEISTVNTPSSIISVFRPTIVSAVENSICIFNPAKKETV